MAGETIASITFTGGGLRNDQIADGAAVAANKLVHQYTVTKELTADATTAMTAMTKWLHIVKGPTGTLQSFQAAIATLPTGNRTCTIDLQKSTAAGAFASILSSTILFNTTSSVRTISSAVISNTSVVAGDILAVVVTLGGDTGTHALGVSCALTLQERLA